MFSGLLAKSEGWGSSFTPRVSTTCVIAAHSCPSTQVLPTYTDTAHSLTCRRTEIPLMSTQVPHIYPSLLALPTSHIPTGTGYFHTPFQQQLWMCDDSSVNQWESFKQQIINLCVVVCLRLLLWQRFETSVTDQLKQFEEDCTHLNSLNTQIMVLLRDTATTSSCHDLQLLLKRFWNATEMQYLSCSLQRFQTKFRSLV